MKKTVHVAGPQRRASVETPFDYLSSNLVLVALAFFAFAFVFQNFVIPSSSMASTLLVGDHVLVDRVTLSPATRWMPFVPYRDVKRGDIVVFYKPVEEPNGEHMPLVKRVIGIPGERIHLRDGVVYRNGAAQQEPFATRPPYERFDAYRDNFPSEPPSIDDPNMKAQWAVELPTQIQGGELVVPAGSYFVMGDNRARSLDSRYWGLVPRENIIGRPLLVYWSFVTPDGLLDDPSRSVQAKFTAYEFLHFFDQTRWRRTLHRVE